MRNLATGVLGLLVFLWIAFTVYIVGRFGGAVLADLDTTGRIMATRNGEIMHSAFGLTYHGIGGAALVVLQLLVVPAALLLSFAGKTALKRLGMVLLALWTMLFVGNALWLQTLGWDHLDSLLSYCIALLIVIAWSALRWQATRDEPRVSAAGAAAE